jgi:hypothetical protein
MEQRREVWAQHCVGSHRSKPTPHSHGYTAIEEAVLVTRVGGVAISRDHVWKNDNPNTVGHSKRMNYVRTL